MGKVGKVGKSGGLGRLGKLGKLLTLSLAGVRRRFRGPLRSPWALRCSASRCADDGK